MPIALLWLHICESPFGGISQCHAVLTSTQLQQYGQTPAFTGMIYGQHAAAEQAIVNLLYQYTQYQYSQYCDATTIPPPTVFLAGCQLPNQMLLLTQFFPNLLQSGLLHHRLIDMNTLIETARRYMPKVYTELCNQGLLLSPSHNTTIWRNQQLLAFFRKTIFKRRAKKLKSSNDEVKHHSDAAPDSCETAKSPSSCGTLKKHQKLDLWIDLELSGLDIAWNVPLEVAALLVDSNTFKVHSAIHMVLAVKPKDMEQMCPWSLEQHERSGLLKEIADSQCDTLTAEQLLIEFLLSHGTLKLVGNSPWCDLQSLKCHLPAVAKCIHDETLDVSVLLECTRWYRSDIYQSRPPIIQPQHRAMTDVRSSLQLLLHILNGLNPDLSLQPTQVMVSIAHLGSDSS